jgi:hypothetical protein
MYIFSMTHVFTQILRKYLKFFISRLYLIYLCIFLRLSTCEYAYNDQTLRLHFTDIRSTAVLKLEAFHRHAVQQNALILIFV